MAHSRSLSAFARFLLLPMCALLLLLGAISAPAHAQNVTFAGAQTTVPASGLYYPFGAAVDAAGDVFIADTYNSRVVKVPAGGGAQTTVGSGLNMPGGVAVDGAGDVFIADTYNSRVVKVPAGGDAQTTVGSGLSYPYGVAVDAAGDVFITDSGNNRVVEVPASGGPQTTVPASGLNYPIGVAVDGAGDVFIGDAGNSRVVEVPASGGPQTTVPASGLSSPYGVAVDGAGDVFIADHVNNLVVEVPASGGAQTTVGSGLYNPVGVAVDGAGDVFIADTDNDRVVEVQTIAVNFGNVNVCPGGQTSPAPCNQTFTLNYSVTATTTFGATKVVTQGAPNLDFTLSSGSTCTGTVSAGTACTVNVTFAPTVPGEREGAVQLFDNSGNLLASMLVHGIGQGPAIAFGPGVQTTVPASGLLYPGSVVVDAAGDVFVADIGNSRVVEVTPNGVQTTVPASGLNQPYGVAVDGAGDVFIADQNNGRVVEVMPSGVQTTVPASGLIYPASVAVDGAGDVFIADQGNNRVVEVTPSGIQNTVPASGLNSPYGVAVDAAGDVFIADSGNYRVVEVTPSGVQTTVGNGLIFPQGVGVDAAGDVFIAGNNQVVEVTPSGVQTAVRAIGLNQPRAVAVDGAGDVFIADVNNNRVVEVQLAQPPSLIFASTNVGSTSSPQSVTVQNIGNRPLNAVNSGLVVTGPNFAQVAGSGTPADCTSSFTLTPGASCNLSLSFEPQSAGPLTSTAVLTDNALNASPSVAQSIALQGTGMGATTVVWSNPAPITYGTPLGAAQLNASATPVSTGTYVYTPPANTVLNAGVQTLSVTFTPSSSSYASSVGSVTLQVNQASQTITFTQAAPATAAYNSSFTVAASASSGLPVAFTASGSCSNVGATYTITSGTGTCSVIANQAGNTNYSAATPVTQSTTATRANPSVTFTGAPASAPYLSAFTLVATTNATAVAYITATNPSTCFLTGPYSPVTVTMLKDSGSCKFTASWGADANYNPATATQSTTAAKATPVVSWATPASITYGNPLGAAQLNATANVLGTFSYTPKSGSIENVGSDTLKVTFTPTSANYKSVTATVALQVTQAATATTITSPSKTVALNSVGIATAVLAYNVTSYKPTGAVTLTATTGEVCTGNINAANGNGSCKLTFNNTGTRTVTASYDGDSNHAGSNSSGQTPAVTVTVLAD